MKKLLIILFLFIGSNVYSQTFTQTFVDRCTGEVKIVTANFVNGSATVAFYNRVRIFTYAEFTSGVLQQWLNETYEWWNTLSPCSTTTQQVQQAQQTAQAAQQAAQTAQSAASSAATAASSAATAATAASTPPTTNTMTGGTNASSNTTNSSTSQNTSTNSTNESGSSNSSGSTESSSGGSGGSSSEGKSEGGGGTSEEGKSSETKSEETETKSGESKESSEESKSEEGGDDGGGEEGGDEEASSDDDGDGEESEEVKEEKKKEDSKKEEKKKKVVTMLPIQLKADAMAMQNPLGGYNAAMSIGASQSSIFGDVSYSATLMVFDNLRQATLGFGKSKVYMDDSYNVDWIESIGINYGNNFGTQSIAGNVMRLKPMGKKGTIGLGVNYTFMFGGMIEKPMGSMGYNLLYTNSLTKPTARLTYSPAFIVSQTPISLTFDSKSVTSSDAMFILANSFTYRLTQRFTFNFGYTAIKSTNPIIPLISSFMFGSKIPF